MSWHFSQALVAGYSAASCSDGEPFALSNATHTHGMFWSPGKTMDVSTRSRSGMTYAPLTETRGAELLTWFQAASHARTYPQPAREKESRENGQGFGRKWHELSVRYDRDTCSWKTHHCLFPEEVPSSSVILPRWGTLGPHGELLERTTSVLPTGGTECGFWPTPCLPGNGGSHGKAKLKAMLWPTPTASAGGPEPEGKTGRKLATAVTMWPTPTTRDYKGVSGAGRQERKGHPQDTLPNAVAARYWPTPTANEDAAGRPGSKMQKMLGNHPDIRGDCTGGSLNPTWVEWLMGWPLGWTDCAVSATARFRQWLEQHGAYYNDTPAVSGEHTKGNDDE